MKGALLAAGETDLHTLEVEILAEFTRLAGGPHASIAVCGLAGENPDDAATPVVDFLTSHGANAERLHAEGGSAHLLRATAVWFTGGDERRLIDAMPAELAQIIQQRNDEGMVVGGSGAGASVLGGAALVASGPQTDVGVEPGGLGLIDELIDPHVGELGRMPRLLAALDAHPAVALGIEEGTAMVAQGGRLRVIGRGAVTVIDATEVGASHGEPDIAVVEHEQGYDLAEHAPLPPAQAKLVAPQGRPGGG